MTSETAVNMARHRQVKLPGGYQRQTFEMVESRVPEDESDPECAGAYAKPWPKHI